MQALAISLVCIELNKPRIVQLAPEATAFTPVIIIVYPPPCDGFVRVSRD